MIEPTLALQTAIRGALIADATVTALVVADHIRAGTTRPDNLPAIIIADGVTQYLGHSSGKQYIARVLLDIHVWTIAGGLDQAKHIGFAVRNALVHTPASADCSIDEFKLTHAVWPRDPDKNYGHGVLSVEAVLRWFV